MSWVTPIAKLIDAIARPLGADPVHGIRVRQIDISCNSEGSSDRVIATYAFEHDAAVSGKVVSFDLSASPLSFVRAQGSRCRVLGPVRFSGGRILLCHLLPGEDWHSASVEICLAWPARSTDAHSPPLTIFPAMLPALVNERFNLGRWPQPVLRYAGDVEPAAFIGTSADENGALRQLALYRGDYAATVSVHPNVALRLGVGLTNVAETQETSVLSLLTDIMRFLAADLRYDVNACILALAVERTPEYPALWGTPCLSESPSAYGLSNGVQPNHATLARSLAGLWWASGCRLAGENAFELSFAICGALGLRWTAHVDSARTARFVEGSLLQSRDAQRPSSARLGWRWLLSLYEHMCRREGVMDTLRRLTAEHYGYVVPAHDVRACLVRAGVALDQLMPPGLTVRD